MTAVSPTRWLKGAPMPWPACMRVSSSTEWPEVVAFCSAAANLRDCQGATRGSFSPVVSNTAGYAVRAMTKSIAIHCQQKNYKIRCNSVHPASIETPMVQGAMGRPGEEQQVPEGVLPAGAIGHPKDIANLVLYLASDESRFVTGAEFLIDNGLTVTPAG